MDKTEERTLVDGLVRMDAASWTRFTSLYYRPLLAFVHSRFGADGQLAEEVVQMTFVRCVRSIGTFDPQRGGLLNWLRAIAGNEAHSIARTRRASEVPMSSLGDDVSATIMASIDTQPLPEEIVAREDVRSAIQEALASVSERHSRALVMKYVDEMSIRQIAQACGETESAVESLLSRAREAFREVLMTRLEGLSERRSEANR